MSMGNKASTSDGSSEEAHDGRGALTLAGVEKKFGDAIAVEQVDLDVRPGEFVTLLGPSGCGKTTTIRMIAGYLAPTSGRIVVSGVDVTSLAPAKRGMGMVFQDYALFPNMTVRDNVAFGLRMKGVRRRERNRTADELIELVGLPHAGDKKPSELSGGMRQRVALARALAIQPQVLLLDEPFSALDAKLRVSLRDEVKRVQEATGVTTLLVTHDQEEALGLSDRVVVMRAGRIEQIGTPQQVYERPASHFVLDFVGRSTRLPAVVRSSSPDGMLSCALGSETVLATGAAVEYAEGDEVVLAVRPERVTVRTGDTTLDGANRFVGTIDRLDFAGNVERAVVRVPALTCDLLTDISPGETRSGAQVTVSFRPEDVIVLHRAGEPEAPSAAEETGDH
jgi:putative spermidine/putrescine transport system ATP-binding protein